MRDVVEARELVKSFGEHRAVDGISFTIGAGEAFGVLGPNGAGKSTTMDMLGGVLRRSGGMLRVLGSDPDVEGPLVRAQLGVVPQDNNLDIELDALGNLVAYGRYFGLPRALLRHRARELLAFVDLANQEHARVQELSGGMRRRLVIARALISRPQILLLDEPTTGLDPQARHAVWGYLRQLRAAGVTLVLTTHFMDEAEHLCERLIVLDRGRICSEGAPQELIARYVSREVVELRFALASYAQETGRTLTASGHRVEIVADHVHVYVPDGEAFLAQWPRDIEPSSVLVRRSSLEDVFLHLTGRSLVD